MDYIHYDHTVYTDRMLWRRKDASRAKGGQIHFAARPTMRLRILHRECHALLRNDNFGEKVQKVRIPRVIIRTHRLLEGEGAVQLYRTVE